MPSQPALEAEPALIDVKQAERTSTLALRASRLFRVDVIADSTTIAELRRMGADGRLSSDHMLVRGDRVRMTLRRREIDLLRAMGLAVTVGPDLLEQARRVRTEKLARAPAVEADGLLTGFVDQYLDTNGILSRFEALHGEFPALTQWIDLPHGTEGYDGAQAPLLGPATVKLFRINTTPASLAKPGLLLIAGIHAREWIPPLAAVEFTEQLLRTYTPGSMNPAVQAINQMVEGLDILIVPAANPDGINFSHHDFAMWRKNRRSNPPPASPCAPGTFDFNGVDNNRNYSIYWGDAGSSGEVCNDSYRGASSFSEPENRNVLHVIEQFPNILTAIDCHSFGEDLFRAQPTGGLFIGSEPVEPRDHQIFLGLEAAMNAAISAVSPGKTYSTGTTNNHAGTCDDYLFLAHRIFGFTLECGQDFQPPVAEALVVVREVTAALRALAMQTLSLASQFTFPVDLVHVIDRSGSMAAFGYIEPAKSNARRMVDLMSLNDTLGIVAFNQTASTPFPLSPVVNPGVYATARAAVDTITASGSTSIGAGLQAAGAQLSSAGGPKAIVLLSDGYQNRAPSVADALPGLPTGTRVHTIALGPHSDQALLETIADATGGVYYFSPDELDLHEIYNFVRAEATEQELALNETLTLTGGEFAESTLSRAVIVDEGASAATFVVSWADAAQELKVTLRPPQGPIMDLRRVRRTDGRGYALLALRRPQAGVWMLEIARASAGALLSCTAAAFLRSDLRLRLTPRAKSFVVGRPIGVAVSIHDGSRRIGRFQGTATVGCPAASPGTLIRDWKKPLPAVPAAQLRANDALPKPVLQALAIREQLRKQDSQDPLRYLRRPGQFQMLSGGDLEEAERAELDLLAVGAAELIDDAIRKDAEPGVGLVSLADTRIPGTYNVRVHVQGRSEHGGRAFLRVGLRSLRVS